MRGTTYPQFRVLDRQVGGCDTSAEAGETPQHFRLAARRLLGRLGDGGCVEPDLQRYAGHLVDVRTGATTRSIDIPDPLARGVVPLPDGWAWIPATGNRVMVQHGGKRSDIAKPSWFGELVGVVADPAGQSLASPAGTPARTIPSGWQWFRSPAAHLSFGP